MNKNLEDFLAISKCLLGTFYTFPFIRLTHGLNFSAQIEIFIFGLLNYELVTRLKSEVRKFHFQEGYISTENTYLT